MQKIPSNDYNLNITISITFIGLDLTLINGAYLCSKRNEFTTNNFNFRGSTIIILNIIIGLPINILNFYNAVSVSLTWQRWQIIR